MNLSGLYADSGETRNDPQAGLRVGKTLWGRAVRPPPMLEVVFCCGSVAERVGGAAELGRRVLAEHRDGADADDRDQSDEQRVLDQRGTLLVVEAGPQPGGEELVRGDHWM